MNLAWVPAFFVAIWGILAVAAGPSAWAAAEHLCVVPVKSEGMTESDKLSFSRIAATPLKFALTKSPIIIRSSHRPKFWTISNDHSLIPYPGSDSPTFPERFLEETHSGRILGENSGRWAVLNNRSGAFQPFNVEGPPIDTRVRRWAYIERWHRSIIATESGVFFLDGNIATPVSGADTATIGRVKTIVELPDIQAVALLTDNNESLPSEANPRRIILLLRDGQLRNVITTDFARNTDPRPFLIRAFLELLTQIFYPSEVERASDRKSGLMDIEYIAALSRLVIMAESYVMVVPVTMRNDAVVLGTPTVITKFKRGSAIRYVKALGQFLFRQAVPDPDGRFRSRLFRVTENGAERIKEDEEVSLNHLSWVIEIPTRQIAIVTGVDRLYLYDGKGPIKPIAGSYFRGKQSTPHIHDLRHMGRVLISKETESGGSELLELTPSNELKPLSLPAAMDGAFIGYLIEMPSSDVVIMQTTNGLFALQRSGAISPVIGDSPIKNGARPSLPGPKFIAERTEILFTTSNGYFLLVDEAISGAGVCDRAAN